MNPVTMRKPRLSTFESLKPLVEFLGPEAAIWMASSLGIVTILISGRSMDESLRPTYMSQFSSLSQQLQQIQDTLSSMAEQM